MKIITNEELKNTGLNRVKKWALNGLFDGKIITEYFKGASFFIQKYDCQIIFTRDTGHHSGGWWKNPDYERCYHLSISFPCGRNKHDLNKIIDNLFGHNKKMIWIESPYSQHGKTADVWHYRLFCDENWKPIIPRGEVYSTQFTEMGWKSFSEIHKK